MNAANTVSSSRSPMHITDRLDQTGVVEIPRRGASSAPIVETRGRHFQHPTGHGDRNPYRSSSRGPVPVELMYQPEIYIGRTHFRAKYADERLSIQSPSACTRFSRRRHTNSARSLRVGPSRRPPSTLDCVIQRRITGSAIPRYLEILAMGFSPDRVSVSARRGPVSGFAAGGLDPP